MFECEICNMDFDADKITEIKGYYICDECIDKNEFVFCEDCDSLIMRADAIYIDGNYYCSECCVHCEDCYQCVRAEDAFVYNNSYICANCYENNYITCERCGEICFIDDATRFDDCYYCNYCYEQVLEDCGIHTYDYKPFCEFLNNENESSSREENLHVGIELEIQGSNMIGFCKEMSDKYDYDDGHFYLKRDGSLDDNGVEIVSQPMTYNYITENEDWKYCFKTMHNYDMKNTVGCGLHFHLDRNYLKETNIQTIDYIVNIFSDYFETAGGREYEYYCQKRNKIMSEWGRDTYSRYSAVNLENANTVELRFCKSTSNYNTFIQRVKIIFAIVWFSRRYNIKDISRWKNNCFMEKFNNIYKERFGSFPNFSLD